MRTTSSVMALIALVSCASDSASTPEQSVAVTSPAVSNSPTASTIASTTSSAVVETAVTTPTVIATTLPPETAPPTTAAAYDPLPPVAQLASVKLAVVDVANLEHPLAFAWRPGDDGTYIADQVGFVYRLDPAGNAEVVLDFKARVTPFESGSERGLLGMTFGPDSRMYLDFTDQQSDTHVVSLAMAGNAPDPATEWEILFIDQPGFGHKAGTLDFDTAGNLYIASGDGAGSNGLDAQDPAKLLGAILRVKPNADGPGYTIPPDNPFVNDPAIRPEKWVTGLRNPWRFTIDDESGEMWLGDVGKDDIEEVDRVPADASGLNFGWYWYEGNTRRKAGAPDGVVSPVWEYSHQVGVSVIAGHVYRGAAIPALRGAFVFGDLTGIMWAFGADGVQELPMRFKSLVAFGEAPDGEFWLASHFGRVARLVPG